MITVRELPSEEFSRLKGLPIAANGLPSDNVLVMVAEDEGEIVGVWSAGLILMLEGLWVDETHRKTSTLWRLFQGMMDKLREDGMDTVHSIVQTDEMLDLAQHGGFEPVPGHFIVKDLQS